MPLYYYYHMNFFNLRKYIFTNLIVAWFYIFLFIIYDSIKHIIISRAYIHSDDKIVWGLIVYICFLILGCLIIFAILEILIRFLIVKKFPNLKLTLNIKIPNYIITIYNILFSIGFISACILFFVAIIFHIYKIYF